MESLLWQRTKSNAQPATAQDCRPRKNQRPVKGFISRPAPDVAERAASPSQKDRASHASHVGRDALFFLISVLWTVAVAAGLLFVILAR
jgi:hypothetical protein